MNDSSRSSHHTHLYRDNALGGRFRVGVSQPVQLGQAELVPDPARCAGWVLLVDGVAQSYVDLDDPTHLEFSYARQIAAVVAGHFQEGSGLRVLHLGGGALCLPRYIGARYPDSEQLVVEKDAALLELVTEHLPWQQPGPQPQIELGEAAKVATACPDVAFDLVISDAYRGIEMSLSVATAQFARQLARIVRPGGMCLVNVTDNPPAAFAKVQAATVASAFEQVGVFAEPKMLAGRRFGNVIIVAVSPPGQLPVAGIERAIARQPDLGAFLCGDQLTSFMTGARPLGGA
jgi:spermidine synthase